mgnify:CR=1 FL=1
MATQGVDLDPRRADAPLWQHAAWQRNAAGLAILAASAQPNDDEGLAVLNAGASGYCHTHAPTATLRQALDVIAGGELWVGRALLSRLLRLVDTRLPRVGLAHWSAPLTEREREVAQLAAIGDSNLTIADALGITERTVKAHLKAVQDILDANDVAWSLNPRLVRGMDYYNLTVFEFITDKLGSQGTI